MQRPEMYDALSTDYDKFVNWPARLAAEMPFLEQRLAAGGRRVLDAASGTGQHAIAFARRGWKVSAADPSAGMLAQARASAAAAGVGVRFEQAGFGGMNRVFGKAAFDAELCLGNSLAHVPDYSGLSDALEDFAACLAEGGLLILQNRNYDRVMSARERWFEPQSHAEAGREWVFIRSYDFETDGSITFNILTLSREKNGNWRQAVSSTRLWPLRAAELTAALEKAGFEILEPCGSARGEPFDPATSPDLVIVARHRARGLPSR
ncbi:MAG: methyltransferase domain-containing protein [Anaerolineales bacterium]